MVRISLVQEYFHPWPNSAGFHLARSRGWYREAGIDLELRTVDPGRADGLGYLAAHEAELAVAPGNRLLVRREAGTAVTAVAAINQRGLETIRTRVDSGIERLRDLAGRRIAYNPTPRGRAIVRALLASDGADPADYIEVDSGSRELDPADFFAGLADASFGSYWSWDILLTNLPPEQERHWRIDEVLGLRYHSYVLAADERLTDAEPALVEDLVAITERGFRAAADNPDEVEAIYERVIPFFPARVVRRSLEEVAPTWFHDGAWGVLREELIGPYAEWLAANGILERPGEWRDALWAPRPAGHQAESLAESRAS
ncbi:MAG: ABC transporter substrate-binding protein [Protaetiibacter sp.]